MRCANSHNFNELLAENNTCPKCGLEFQFHSDWQLWYRSMFTCPECFSDPGDPEMCDKHRKAKELLNLKRW
jgi:hypothetical protein